MKTMDEALQIKAEVEPDLINKPGVTGIDVGYRVVDGKRTEEPAIRVYVANKEAAVKALSLPGEIQGVAVEIIERKFELH